MLLNCSKILFLKDRIFFHQVRESYFLQAVLIRLLLTWDLTQTRHSGNPNRQEVPLKVAGSQKWLNISHACLFVVWPQGGDISRQILHCCSLL